MARGYARTLYLIGCKMPKGRLGLHPCNVVSFNEGKASRFLEELGPELAREHHACCLSRVYPSARRFDSRNYDPTPLWLGGFQMVALNYQSSDLPMVVNEGLFSHENGGCGYVLKPPWRQPSKEESPASPASPHSYGPPLSPPATQGTGECVIELRVLSGHDLPKPDAMTGNETIKPMVRVSLCGAAQDRSTLETSRVMDNGFNPCWDWRMTFRVTEPEVAVLAFEVFHVTSASDNRAAAAASPDGRTAPGTPGNSEASGASDLEPPSAGPRPNSEESGSSATLSVPRPMSRRRLSNKSNSSGSSRSSEPPAGGELDGADGSNALAPTPTTGSGAAFAAAPTTPRAKPRSLLASNRPRQELVASAAFPMGGLREGVRWAPLRDGRFRQRDRCGLLLHCSLNGPWAQERRGAAAPSAAVAGAPQILVVPPTETSPLAAKVLAGGLDCPPPTGPDDLTSPADVPPDGPDQRSEDGLVLSI